MKRIISMIRSIDFYYHFDLFIRCMKPTLSLLVGITIMLFIFPSSATEIFLFNITYTVFMAKILFIVFMYNLGNFIIREFLISGGVK